MNYAEIAKELTAELCQTVQARHDGDGEITVSSPFLFDDGDTLPVFLRHGDGGWRLTDQGMTVSHLFFDEFQFTEARFGRISQLVASHSAELTEQHEIALQLERAPTAYDVASFLQLVAQVQGVALTSRTDRDQNRYVTTVRTSVEERLKTADYDENWSPPELLEQTRATYRADLRMHSADGADVLLFAASTSDKANVSALTMGQFKRLAGDRKLVPLLAYHPGRVASEALYRFQDEVETPGAALAVEPGDTRALARALKDRNVALTDD